MKAGLMENKFNTLGVTPAIVKAIKEMGFINPTLVQEKAIPHVLNKEDLIVMSKTGSGKTGAFGIPMLQLIDNKEDGPQGLILTPTRELAVQVDNDLKRMSKYLKINTTAVYGQHNIETEIKVLKKGVSIIIGTPGRIFDHIQRKTFNTKNIKMLVLDEADRMLDMGFIDQVFTIVKTLPKQRITMMFSATMPREMKQLSKSYMKEPTVIELESDTKTVDTTKQVYYRVRANEKRKQLDRLLKLEQPDGCLIFCNTRSEVDKVTIYLAKKRYFVGSIHGANSQSSRIKTLEKIKKGELQIVVATDVAARGLHIDDLTHVINYDVPFEKDSYVHRIGRTGRAGKSGKAIAIVTTEDIMSLYEIEEHVGVLIEEASLPTDEEIENAVANSKSKWANKKAPIQSEHITRHNTTRNHKVYNRSNNKKKTRSHNYKKEYTRIPHKEEPIKKVHKHITENKVYTPTVNKNYRPQKNYQRIRNEAIKSAKQKKSLLKKVSRLFKKK